MTEMSLMGKIDSKPKFAGQSTANTPKTGIGFRAHQFGDQTRRERVA